MGIEDLPIVACTPSPKSDGKMSDSNRVQRFMLFQYDSLGSYFFRSKIDHTHRGVGIDFVSEIKEYGLSERDFTKVAKGFIMFAEDHNIEVRSTTLVGKSDYFGTMKDMLWAYLGKVDPSHNYAISIRKEG